MPDEISRSRSVPELSVVVPCYREAAGIQLLLARLLPVLESLVPSFEILLINDGSPDNTEQEIWAAAQRDPRVKGVSLSRNFGHQAALIAGLERAQGRAVISMDADLQHPPEVIRELVSEWKSGFEIVQAVRQETQGIGILKRLSSVWFYRLFQVLAHLSLPPGSSDFRLLDRKPLTALLALSESSRFLRGLVSWIGFKRKEIVYTAESRSTGTSGFTLVKMLRLALDAIVSFSDRPLYFSLFIGLALGFGIVVYGLFVIEKAWEGAVVPGWTSSILLTGAVGSVLLINQGLQGLYLSRLYREAKKRPIYIVRDETP